MKPGRIPIDPIRVRQLHDTLLARYGPQEWWPGDSDFEVMAGTILVQRTRWDNAAVALARLAGEGLLEPESLAECPLTRLETIVEPAGFYRQKARRLRAASRWLVGQGGLEPLRRLATGALRERLLEVEGIGQETADCILLYVFQRAVFVADAYARRLFRRLGWIAADGSADYSSVAEAVTTAMGEGHHFFNELHALIVAHGKEVCGDRPRCPDCCLRDVCPSAGSGPVATGLPGTDR